MPLATSPALPLLVCTTVATRDDARHLAQALVERRLVACAQIGEIESVYRWDGAVQQGPEWRLLLKTVPARYEAVAAAIHELHPYALPALHAVRCEQVDAAYAAWIETESR